MLTLPITIYALAVLLSSCLLSIYFVPKVKRIVYIKHLMDEPNHRSSHIQSTPSLGGIAFYIIFVFGLYFNDKFDEFNVSMSILPGITLMFFLGLKDDLVGLSARVKLMGQILSCGFVLFHYKFEIDSFHGFFGIFDMPIWISVPLALLIMLTIINAYNLVDGIDGLAASIGTVTLASFAFLFFWIGHDFLALTAVTMIGALLGFLYFNLSVNKKIFMGDTGSLVLGFLIAALSIRLLALNTGLEKLPFNPKYIPVLMGIIILVPLFDVIRVFTIRIIQGKSPLTADRIHIHHIIIDRFKWSHRRTAFVISLLSFKITLCSLVLIWVGFEFSILVLFLIMVVFAMTVLLHIWRKSNEELSRVLVAKK